MATVYEAEHTRLHRRVAIKVLDPSLTNRPDFVDRFQREAETIAQLEHPHILPVYDTGEEGDLLYLVMFLVRDGTLKNRLRSTDPPPWAPRRVLQLASQILPALDVAHSQGIVHRDIKPDNILLHGDRAFLSDFGIAKLLMGDPGLTVIGTFVGTPEYAAPEQVLALPLDGRSDLYAFGVVLYELLVGHVPYQGDTPMGVALQHVQATLTPPTQANPDLAELLARVLVNALAKERDRRYPTGAALVAALEEAVRETEALEAGGLVTHATPTVVEPTSGHSSYPSGSGLLESEQDRAAADLATAARREADLEAQRLAAEAEARRQAEEAEARRLAEEAEAARREAEVRRLADLEAQRLAAEAEARRQAEAAEARRQAEEAEARRQAEAAEARRLAEEEQARRDAEARRQADLEAQRLAAEAEARRQAEEAEAQRQAEA
ncbi:MAG: serine/threonine protein kinase, partial [Chloroflexi bacterium]|nr:serine/threonine protein kinase [Chloroflexota bacterium]